MVEALDLLAQKGHHLLQLEVVLLDGLGHSLHPQEVVSLDQLRDLELLRMDVPLGLTHLP